MEQSIPRKDRTPMVVDVGITVYVVAVFFVALRFVTRGWLVRKFGRDDLLIAVALLFGAGQTVALQLQVHQVQKQRLSGTTSNESRQIFMYRYIGMSMYYLANGAVKLSILALYCRICSLQKAIPWYLQRPVIWTIGATIIIFTLSTLFVDLFSCYPVSAIFDLENPARKCIPWIHLYIPQASIDVLINLVLLLFPLPLLGVLKIDKKQRYLLILVFSIGLLPLIASVVRLCQIAMTMGTKTLAKPSGDSRWEGMWIPYWSQIEVDISIVAASLPSLRPLLKHIWSDLAYSRTMGQSHLPGIIETGFNKRGGEAQGLRKLPSATTTLPSESATTLGEPENTKRLTFFDGLEDQDADKSMIPLSRSTTRVEGATSDNISYPEALGIDVPLSDRRSDNPIGLSYPEAAVLSPR